MFDSGNSYMFDSGNSFHKSGTSGWLELRGYMIRSRAAWFQIRRFMIRTQALLLERPGNCSEIPDLWTERPGHCSEIPDLWTERPGHCSEIQDLWFKIRDAWLELCRFMIRSTGRMNRKTVGLWLDRPGHCSEIPDLWLERPGHCSSMNRNTRFMIRLTGSLTSFGTRNGTPPQTTFCRVIFLSPRPGQRTYRRRHFFIWQNRSNQISYS